MDAYSTNTIITKDQHAKAPIFNNVQLVISYHLE